MPHAWLTAGRSTLDTLGGGSPSLTPDPDHWARHTDLPWPLHSRPLPADPHLTFDLGRTGALLVRPTANRRPPWREAPPGDAALSGRPQLGHRLWLSSGCFAQ